MKVTVFKACSGDFYKHEQLVERAISERLSVILD